MEGIVFSLSCALVAWTASNILMESGGIIHRYFVWLDLLAYNGKGWLARPLGLCGKCLAGQIALWTGFVFLAEQYAAHPIETAVKHLVLLCLAVFVTYQLDHFKTTE